MNATVTLTLIVNSWTGSALNVAIAKGIIEHSFPLVNVAIKEIPGGVASLESMFRDRDEAVALLEVWTNGKVDVLTSLKQVEAIEDLGSLGVVGQVGWYVPDYVLSMYPEAATWKFYQTATAANLFATPETAPKGRFLGVDPTWTGPMDEHIVKNLEMPFKRVFAGNESAAIAILDDAVAARDPILMYWWSPTAAAGRYNLKKVQLPAITKDCEQYYEKAREFYDCDYPSDPLIKVVSAGLRSKSPELFEFLQKFTISAEVQLELLPRVVFDSESVQDVAADWIAQNEEVWQLWLPGAKTEAAIPVSSAEALFASVGGFFSVLTFLILFSFHVL